MARPAPDVDREPQPLRHRRAGRGHRLAGPHAQPDAPGGPGLPDRERARAALGLGVVEGAARVIVAAGRYADRARGRARSVEHDHQDFEAGGSFERSSGVQPDARSRARSDAGASPRARAAPLLQSFIPAESDLVILVEHGGRERDDRKVTPGHVEPAQSTGGLVPVDAGHHDVHEHEVEGPVGEQFESLLAALREVSGRAEAREQTVQDQPVVVVVVDDDVAVEPGPALPPWRRSRGPIRGASTQGRRSVASSPPHPSASARGPRRGLARAPGRS